MQFNNKEDIGENEGEKYVTVDGISVRYAVRGAGPPVVLLHGFCEFLETWDLNLRALSQHFRVYALDLPGHGLSDKPYLDYTISFFAGFIIDFMHSVGIDRASLVSHSFGGAIAISITVGFPEQVDRLVLESSFGLNNDVTLLHKLCSIPVLAGAERTGSAVSTHLEQRIGVEFHNPDPIVREIVRRSYLFMQMPEARRVMLNVMHNWVNVDGLRPEVVMLDRLSLVKAPTLFIHGDRDDIHPLELSQHAQRLVPNSRLKVFNSCGHCPHLERAAEFNHEVLAFLGKD